MRSEWRRSASYLQGEDHITVVSANLCTESRTHELLEQAFEVVVVTDATVAAKLPGSTTFHVERSLDAHPWLGLRHLTAPSCP